MSRWQGPEIRVISNKLTLAIFEPWQHGPFMNFVLVTINFFFKNLPVQVVLIVSDRKLIVFSCAAQNLNDIVRRAVNVEFLIKHTDCFVRDVVEGGNSSEGSRHDAFSILKLMY
jgi:hypothetical protein